MSNKRIVIFGYSSSSHIHKWVRSLTQRGYQIRVISLGGDPIQDIETVIIPRKNKLSYFISCKQAVKAALEFEPDIIHTHYAGGYGYWGMKTDFHPFVVSVWGSDIHSLPKSFMNRFLIKQILQNADIVTATSESLKSSTLKLQPNLKNIQTIPFGVAIPSDEVSSEPNQNSAIFIKHLEPVYAPDLLVKAVKIVKQKFPDFTLTIAGKGSMQMELEQMIESLGLSENIVMTGYIKNEDIYKHISNHQFMVMPSLEEGFGVAAVEAFACSRPVVATTVGGIPEIVTDDVNGYLVEPNNVEALANAMIRIVSNPEKSIQMGQNGYKVAREKYNWERSVEMMVNLYETV